MTNPFYLEPADLRALAKIQRTPGTSARQARLQLSTARELARRGFVRFEGYGRKRICSRTAITLTEYGARVFEFGNNAGMVIV